ncbi:MAG: DUF1439 domain-containing protein [Comamonadaceae bacterium]|nr:MAG: DUF1439 domain-containing protein [Comamonadaceae bacterium]
MAYPSNVPDSRAQSASMPVSLASRRRLIRLAVVLVAMPLPLTAGAGFNFFTGEFTAGQAELQAQIARRFPLQQRYAELFTVSLRDPRLALDPAANRAAITALLSIASPLMRTGRAEGLVTVSSALRYDAPARTLRLDQPRAERLELQGLGGRDAERLQQIGGIVAQELLRDQALHTFTAEELTVGRKTYSIGAITVQRDAITVQLE